MRIQKHPTFGFTTKSTGIRNVLLNEIHVSEVYDPSTGTPEPVKRPYDAIWDTGATHTVVTRKVVQELNLQASGRVSVQAVGAGDQVHEYDTDTFLVNIYLPNNVVIVGIRVAEGAIGGADVLLGMDIIANGDFAITNYNGQTWWTFRVPSNEPIDFVEEIQQHQKLYGPGGPFSPEEKRKQRNIRKRERRKVRKK